MWSFALSIGACKGTTQSLNVKTEIFYEWDSLKSRGDWIEEWDSVKSLAKVIETLEKVFLMIFSMNQH